MPRGTEYNLFLCEDLYDLNNSMLFYNNPFGISTPAQQVIYLAAYCANITLLVLSKPLV